MIDSSKLKIGTKVNYGFFKDITFCGILAEGYDKPHVLLHDKYNNEKKVYKSLFDENSEIANG